MIEVNLEHMDFVYRDFVTRNSEKINQFLDMDGGKVPSRVKGAVSYTHLTLPTTPYV